MRIGQTLPASLGAARGICANRVPIATQIGWIKSGSQASLRYWRQLLVVIIMILEKKDAKWNVNHDHAVLREIDEKYDSLVREIFTAKDDGVER